MKQPVRSSAKNPQQTAKNPSTQPQQHRQPAAGQPGSLGRLAEIMNQSPRVQAQLKLAEEINSSPQVAAQRSLAAEVNAGPAAAQLKRLEEKPAQTKSRLDEKLKQPKFADAAQQKRMDEKLPTQTKKKEELRQHKMADGAAQLAAAPAPNQTGLPDNLKAGVESLSGVSLDSVKVHYNSPKPAQLNALAYAQGKDIHVGPGQEKHLPHEAWHITQQSQGRVRPTMQTKAGVPVNDDRGLEKEADVMGARAVQMVEDTSIAGDFRVKDASSHAEGCACAACSSGARPAEVFQRKSATVGQVVQRKPCSECGKEKGHLSGCSRNPHNRGVKAQEEQKENKQKSSWENMQAYRPGWVKRNGITEDMVREFCKQYSEGKIRGHHSGDDSEQEHANTTTDLNAYKSWHTHKYGGWQ